MLNSVGGRQDFAILWKGDIQILLTFQGGSMQISPNINYHTYIFGGGGRGIWQKEVDSLLSGDRKAVLIPIHFQHLA